MIEINWTREGDFRKGDVWRRFIRLGEMFVGAMVNAERLLLGNEEATLTVVRDAMRYVNGVDPEVEGDKVRRLAARYWSGLVGIQRTMNENVMVRLVVWAATFESAWYDMQEEADKRLAHWETQGNQEQREIWIARREALCEDPRMNVEVITILTEMAAAAAASDERTLVQEIQSLTNVLDGCSYWWIFDYMDYNLHYEGLEDFRPFVLSSDRN
jgi:hypothetical protein